MDPPESHPRGGGSAQVAVANLNEAVLARRGIQQKRDIGRGRRSMAMIHDEGPEQAVIPLRKCASGREEQQRGQKSDGPIQVRLQRRGPAGGAPGVMVTKSKIGIAPPLSP